MLAVDSLGAAECAPTPAGVEYTLVYLPDAASAGFRIQFEMVNTSGEDAPDGDVRLDWLEVTSVKPAGMDASKPEATWSVGPKLGGAASGPGGPAAGPAKPGVAAVAGGDDAGRGGPGFVQCNKSLPRSALPLV